MSYEDELKAFMKEEGMDPEAAFSMVTLMPKKKLKISAFLEDDDGDRISLSDLAEDVVRYIEENMGDEESSMINSQFFPLINKFMTLVVPRATDLRVAEFMFTAGALRHALSYFGMAVALMMQYISQHNLKIVTEEETITDQELEDYLEQSKKAEQALARALGAPGDGHEL